MPSDSTPQRPPHFFRGLSHDREPDARSFVGPLGRSALEYFEKTRLRLRRNADSFVFDPEPHHVPSLFGSHRDARRLSGADELRGIGQEIAHALPLSDGDRDFLVSVAAAVLGKTAVAATPAEALQRMKIDPVRVNSLIPSHSRAVEVGGYVLKKVEADIETPGNFGLFVRRKGT